MRQAQQSIQLQRGSQCVALRARLHLDPVHAYLSRNAHTASVATEPIGRPSCRGRKIELVILGARRKPDEGLEAGMLPQLIGARCRHHRRHAHIADLAGHEIAQYQAAGAWTRDFRFDVCRREAKRVRMKPQDLAHTGIVAAAYCLGHARIERSNIRRRSALEGHQGGQRVKRSISSGAPVRTLLTPLRQRTLHAAIMASVGPIGHMVVYHSHSDALMAANLFPRQRR